MSAPTGSTIIPCLRYDDAPRMIDWLREAFGFEAHVVHRQGDTVHHAQLVHGGGMLMLGSTQRGSDWGDLITQPRDTRLSLPPPAASSGRR